MKPPVPLIGPEKLPLAAAVKVKGLGPNAIEPEPEMPPSETDPPALAKLRAPFAATWLVTGPATAESYDTEVPVGIMTLATLDRSGIAPPAQLLATDQSPPAGPT